MNIEVDRQQLIAALKKRQQEAQASYGKALKEYEAKASKFLDVVHRALRDAIKTVEAKDIDALDTYETRYGHINVPLDRDVSAPQKPLGPEALYEGRIKALEMSKVETVKLTEHEAARFLGNDSEMAVVQSKRR